MNSHRSQLDPSSQGAQEPPEPRITVEDDGLYVRLELHGVLTHGRIDSAIRVALDMDGFTPGAGTLWDLGNADVSSLSANDFRRMRQGRRELAERRGDGRVALLASDDLTFGIARMVEASTEVPGTTIMVFRDEDEAVDWVRGRDNADGRPLSV